MIIIFILGGDNIKRFKHFMVLIILLVLFCSLTTISATDSNDTITDSDSLNEQDYSNTQSPISTDANTNRTVNTITKSIQKNNDENTYLTKADSDVGTREELEQILNDASEGSIVFLVKDYDFKTKLSINKAIPINKTLTIDGQGHALNGINKTEIFKITADNVILRNITFLNAWSIEDSGGVAIDWIGKNGILENCIFKDNKAYEDSFNDGLVYVKGDAFTARNCYFENNIVFRGAGLYLDSNNNHIINCTFNGNNGYNDDFFNRSSTLKYSAGSGIFINEKNNVIENCIFENQSTVYGTIYVDGEKNIIKNNTIRNNYVYKDGGAIYINQPNNKVTDCIIENNTAKQNGGAIYLNDKNNEINNCWIYHNFAAQGGAFYINKQNNTVNSCIILDNRASKKGSAMYVDAKNNNIYNNMFRLNNLNDNSNNMGTLNDIYSTVSMSADKNWWGNINKDICSSTSYNMNDKNVKPTTNNDKVTVNNWYYIDVVDKSGNSIPKIITRIGDFVGNTFDLKFMFKLSSGNGDFNYPDYTNEFNLTGDKLSLFDGSIYTNKITREFTGDSLSFNMLTNEPKSTLKMENNWFGIDVHFTFKETYPLTRLQNIIDNVWENDTAYIYDDYKYDPDVDADMINGIIINKTITIDGKGATIDLDYKTRGFYVNAPEVTIKNINIINGNLGNGGMGGAIYFSSKFGEIINTTFEGNTADYGGAVAVTQDYVTVTNSTFKNNYASEKGAGIYVVAKGLRITNNLFDSNHAAYGENPCVEGYTWAIYFSDNNTYINNSITGIGGKDDDDISPSNKPKGQFSIVNRKSFTKQIFHDKITVNGKEIPITNNQLTLDILNQIFNQNFTNGHLLVYIDGKLVFNDTTTDDLSQLIYNLINLLSGKHEIKVEFTDKDGNTNTYTETITV